MNAPVIPSDVHIDENILAALIKEQFNFKPSDIKLLGEGFDNAVFLVDHKWVFRLPRRLIAISLIETEMRVLPRLHGHLPIDIPIPKFCGVPSPDFPRPFYGHALIEGEPGSSVHLDQSQYADLAETLGQFLQTLHAISPRDILSQAENPPFQVEAPPFPRENYAHLKTFFDERFPQIARDYDLSAFKESIESICQKAQNYQPDPNKVLVHGDMYHRHLIFNRNKRLSGVIDWGDCGLGDRVADLGVVYQFLPKDVRPIFFNAYGDVKPHVKDYARFLGIYYAVALLWFGHARGDKDLIRTSLWTFANV